MDGLGCLLLLGGFYPLWRGWQAVRGTPLPWAVAWAVLAWGGWLTAAGVGWLRGSAADSCGYVALCLTACAGVAVLGARRPGAGAWNFVVLGLLAALLRPFAEGFGELRLEPAHLVFLSFVLAVGTVNYLPTRNGLPVLALAGGWGLELARLAGDGLGSEAQLAGRLLLAAAPWLALVLARRRARPASAVDELWLCFRDRFGLVWGQRARDQFNRAAANAGWAVTLGWGGLHVPEEGKVPEEAQVLALLRGVLKRFGPEQPASP
jgi:hypothetical protein